MNRDISALVRVPRRSRHSHTLATRLPKSVVMMWTARLRPFCVTVAIVNGGNRLLSPLLLPLLCQCVLLGRGRERDSEWETAKLWRERDEMYISRRLGFTICSGP